MKECDQELNFVDRFVPMSCVVMYFEMRCRLGEYQICMCGICFVFDVVET